MPNSVFGFYFQTPPANAYRRVDLESAFGTLPRRHQTSQLSAFNHGMGIHGGIPGSPLSPPSSRNVHTVHQFKNPQGSFLISPQLDPNPVSFHQLQLKPFHHLQQPPYAVVMLQEDAFAASGVGGAGAGLLHAGTENGSRSTSAPHLGSVC